MPFITISGSVGYLVVTDEEQGHTPFTSSWRGSRGALARERPIRLMLHALGQHCQQERSTHFSTAQGEQPCRY